MTAELPDDAKAQIVAGCTHMIDVLTADLPHDMDYGEFTRTDWVTVILCCSLDSIAGFLGRDDLDWTELALDQDKRHAAAVGLMAVAQELAEKAE